MSTSATSNPLEQFRWTPQPAAEQLVKEIVHGILARDTAAARFRDRMRDEAGVRFIDCIDHLVVDQAHVPPQRLADLIARDRPRWAKVVKDAQIIAE